MDGFQHMWDTDGYDECPAADVAEVCDRILVFLKRRRFQPSLPPQKLHRSILEYIWLRYTALPQHISYPKRKQEAPRGWNIDKERIWRQHIFRVCEWDDWVREVMHPVFGTNERLWEAPISKDWRMEILEFLPWWVYRDLDLLEDVDPTPLPEPEEIAAAEAAARKKEIDPYILDHGGRRARRQAEKEGGPVSG